MSIRSSSILVDGTVAITAGTATGAISKGNDLNVHTVVLDDSSEFIDQTVVSFTAKDPKASATAPNGYTQQRQTVKINVPLALDNGNRTVNTVTLTIAVDPETTDAERLSLRVLATNVLNDADFTAFWDDGSLD